MPGEREPGGVENALEKEFDGVPAFHAASVDDWRAWLEANCRSATSVWLIVYHKRSRTPSAHFHDVIEHALCYGWVDSKAVKRDGKAGRPGRGTHWRTPRTPSYRTTCSRSSTRTRRRL